MDENGFVPDVRSLSVIGQSMSLNPSRLGNYPSEEIYGIGNSFFKIGLAVAFLKKKLVHCWKEGNGPKVA